MEQGLIFWTIVGMCLVTYIPRAAPMLVLAQRSMPEPVIRWLSFVPTAVLSAMLLPSIIMPGNTLSLGADNIFIWAAVPSLVLAVLTRSFFGTVALGMVIVAGGRFLF